MAHDKIGRCLGYLSTEADPDPSILWCRILVRDTSGVWKSGVLHFSVNYLRNGASCALNQYVTLMGNRIRRIESYNLRVPTRTRSAQRSVRNLSISFVYWCKQRGCYGWLPVSCLSNKYVNILSVTCHAISSTDEQMIFLVLFLWTIYCSKCILK